MTVAAGFVAAIVLASRGITGLELTKGSRVRLLSDETSFRESFRRFPNDALNGLSPAKLNRLGQEVEILQMYEDETVTCKFDDGVQYDMPIEALSPHASSASQPIPTSRALSITKSEVQTDQAPPDQHYWRLAVHSNDSCTDLTSHCSELDHAHCNDEWTARQCCATCGQGLRRDLESAFAHDRDAEQLGLFQDFPFIQEKMDRKGELVTSRTSLCGYALQKFELGIIAIIGSLQDLPTPTPVCRERLGPFTQRCIMHMGDDPEALAKDLTLNVAMDLRIAVINCAFERTFDLLLHLQQVLHPSTLVCINPSSLTDGILASIADELTDIRPLPHLHEPSLLGKGAMWPVFSVVGTILSMAFLHNHTFLEERFAVLADEGGNWGQLPQLPADEVNHLHACAHMHAGVHPRRHTCILHPHAMYVCEGQLSGGHIAPLSGPARRQFDPG